MNFSKLTNSGFTFIFLLIVVCTKLSFANGKIQIPTKGEVLNTLKYQHPNISREYW